MDRSAIGAPGAGDAVGKGEQLWTTTAEAGAIVAKLTNEFLERVVAVATAMDGDDQAAGITFALACYELAGKEAPDFGRFTDGDNGA